MSSCLASASQFCCGSRGKRLSRLYLIRHGETVWNAERRIQGQLDIDINDNGMKQAEAAALALSKLGILPTLDAVVSSDLLRASRTADIIAAAAARGSGRRPARTLDPQLREIGYGKLQGTESDNADCKKLQSSTFNAWIEGDLSKGFPEGETGYEFLERILQGLRQAAGLGEAVVVVAHGGLIRWSAAQIAPTPDEAKRLVKSPIVNCCCSTLVYDHDSDSFHAEEWFADLQKSSGLQAKDDTG
ncbi:Probable phosphoglycerate mutase GpmB (PGAM) (Phosphoglyceromutase) [Durusdinium trenchii]|uniref:Probable phosphoglycerate mutase GpmB (PGAM) (Phosphoglyceromutase) n=1 Tax=Durusdinium trenchii TaxID=1381693 RepID=A0ABP0MNU3_9DINO